MILEFLSPNGSSESEGKDLTTCDGPQGGDIGNEVQSSLLQRAASPAPTEIVDDESSPIDDIISIVKAQGIKIRDFGSPEERCKTVLNDIPEIFDQYRAIAKFEYKLSINSKTHAPSGSSRRWPISGRSLYRLLDIAWISEEEVARRCLPMDINALSEYKKRLARDVREGRGIYPWRALPWSSVPTSQERSCLLAKFKLEFVGAGGTSRQLGRARECEERLSAARAEGEAQEAILLRDFCRLTCDSKSVQCRFQLHEYMMPSKQYPAPLSPITQT